MTPDNSYYLETLWDDPKIRSYTMAITTITPKFFSILNYMMHSCTNESIINATSVLKKDCYSLLSYYDSYLIDGLRIPRKALTISQYLYQLYDDVVLSDCIEDKIKAWKTAYLIALKQVNHEMALKVVFQEQTNQQAFQGELETDSLKENLMDYLEIFYAWSEIQYVDECPLYNKIVNALEEITDSITLLNP